MKRVFVVVGLIASAIGAPRAESATQTMDNYPPPGGPPLVTVLSPGASPQRAIRFAVRPSSTTEFDLTMQVTMGVTTAGVAVPEMKMPTITLGGDLAVTDVASSGDISYTVTYRDVKIGTDADPAIAAVMPRSSEPFTPLSMTSVISPRGVTRVATLELGAGVDPQMRAMLTQLTNQAQNLSIPFPEEMVGVGARWEARQTVAAPGMQIFQRAEYELVSIDEQTATLSVKIEQTAPSQPVSLPGLPVPGSVRLVSHVGSGTGTTSIRLDRLVPESTLSIDATTNMEMSMNGVDQPMTMKMSMKMTTTPRQ